MTSPPLSTTHLASRQRTKLQPTQDSFLPQNENDHQHQPGPRAPGVAPGTTWHGRNEFERRGLAAHPTPPHCNQFDTIRPEAEEEAASPPTPPQPAAEAEAVAVVAVAPATAEIGVGSDSIMVTMEVDKLTGQVGNQEYNI